MSSSRHHVPLVMLPGSMCDHRLFAHQFEALGPGVVLGDLTQHSSIEDMAEQVLAIAPDRFAVAGLSLGGIVAAEIAARSPERLLGLAVMDTNLAMPDSQQLEIHLQSIRVFATDEAADALQSMQEKEIERLQTSIQPAIAALYQYFFKPVKSVNATVVRSSPKVGRNELCPCGSGKKYKKCCGLN